MFKTLSGLTDNAFWRVSADTKTCGSPRSSRSWRESFSPIKNIVPNFAYFFNENLKYVDARCWILDA